MSNSHWFSAKVRMVVLVEPKGAEQFVAEIYVFKSLDWDQALDRALELGRAHEQEYLNAAGQRVRWKLHSVLTLDMLPDQLDGAEVYSESSDIPEGEHLPFDVTLDPAQSRPAQTI